MEVEEETNTTITLDGDYSVDIYVNGEFEWDLATNELTTEIQITEND